jgi:hypothetical protein
VPVPVSLIGIVMPRGPRRATSFALASARWYSTLRWLRNSPPALPLLAPATTSRATRSSWGVSVSHVLGHVCARSPPVARSSSRARSAHRPVPRPSNVSSAARSWIRRVDPAPVAAQALAEGEEGPGLDLVLPAGYRHSTGPQTFVHIWPPHPNTNHNRSRAAGARTVFLDIAHVGARRRSGTSRLRAEARPASLLVSRS